MGSGEGSNSPGAQHAAPQLQRGIALERPWQAVQLAIVRCQQISWPHVGRDAVQARCIRRGEAFKAGVQWQAGLRFVQCRGGRQGLPRGQPGHRRTLHRRCA